MDPRRFVGWAEEFGCTWYTAAPTIHQLVLDAPGDWQGFRFMRSASASLPPQLAAGLESRFGAPMIEVYGMTEAYQIAANPLPPGQRRLGSVGLPTGTEIAVLDATGQVRFGEHEGEIIVRGPAVFTGYSSPAGANEEAFVEGWFRTGDVGRIDADGRLTITGRLKEQINRGGEKIAPREIEEALLDLPSVVEAMAFAIPDPQLGEEIGVAIVVAPGSSIDAVEVRAYLARRLAAFKVPKRVLVVDRLPKSDTGKLQRLAFAQQHAAELVPGTASHAGVAEDGGSVEQRLGLLWQEVLELVEPPRSTDVFFDLGGTSLAVMELVVRIEDEFGIDLPLLDVLEVPSLADLAARLETQIASSTLGSLLRLYRRGTSGASIVLIPGQMGMAVGLNLIADAIAADVDVYLFDYPGHRAGETPLESVEAITSALLGELAHAGLTEKLALYGNSLGGWVALEAARKLAAADQPPLLVGIGDMYSPFFNSKASPLRPSFAQRVRNRVRRGVRDARRRTGSHPSMLQGRAPSAVVRQQAVSRASEIARRRYRSHPYTGDVLVVIASERAPKFGPTLGYDRHVSGSIRTLTVAGGHSNMHREQAAPIGAALSERLRSHHAS
jgi:acyl carrier protein/thioesterase domain-containing protein